MKTGVTIKEIHSKSDLRKFIRFPEELYAGNNNYVPVLRSEELKTLSADKNPAHEFCISKYWLAYQNRKIVGRIAGIIHNRYNKNRDIKYARFGWLDFVNDLEVLQALMDTVESWAQKEGMDHIHGPIGFSSFDPSGILIKGFDETPTAFSHYNHPYYPELLEKAGYEKDIDWVEYNVKVPEQVPEKVILGAKLIKKRYGLHSAELKSRKDILKHANGIFELLNSVYRGIYAFSQLSDKQIDCLKKQFITILDPAYVSVILDSSDKVIAFGITMPSLSRSLQKSKGSILRFALFRILNIYQKTRTVDTLLIAVKKEFQNKGITGIIFSDIIPVLIQNDIESIESTKEMEENKSVKNLWHSYEHRQHKRTRCYIKKL